jgi:hypothetical protein
MTKRLGLLCLVCLACACSSTGSGIGNPGGRPKCSSGGECASGVCVDGVCVPVEEAAVEEEAAPLFEVAGGEADGIPEVPAPEADGAEVQEAVEPEMQSQSCTEPLEWECKDTVTLYKCANGKVFKTTGRYKAMTASR